MEAQNFSERIDEEEVKRLRKLIACKIKKELAFKQQPVWIPIGISEKDHEFNEYPGKLHFP